MAGLHCPHHRVHRKGVRHLHPWNPYRVRRGCQHPALGTLFTPVTAAGFLAFTLLYTPCVAAISAVKRELGSGWKAAGVALSQCVIAWMVAFLVYHIAALLLG